MEAQQPGRVFLQDCRFIGSYTHGGMIPQDGPMEIAMAGRSNVGKSSLINALAGRKALARTSNTPGRTQTLNLYEIGAVLRLVDMPGYGYARASKDDVRIWQDMMRGYIRMRSSLRGVLILVDARHGLKDSDLAMMTMLQESALHGRIVLSKCDKVKTQALAALQTEITDTLRTYPIMMPQPLAISAHSGLGILELRDRLAQGEI